MLSILAGMMIAIGGIIYLSVGGVAGALLFSMGLLTVLTFQLELFTGKAGLLATNDISIGKLTAVWLGNFIGAAAIAGLLLMTPVGIQLAEKANAVVALRTANGPLVNCIYGVFCGILMYIAVTAYKKQNSNPLYAMLPVAIFILAGFNHAIADMFYVCLGMTQALDLLVLIPTTIGNLIGCCVIPLALRAEYHHQPQQLRRESKTQSLHDSDH